MLLRGRRLLEIVVEGGAAIVHPLSWHPPVVANSGVQEGHIMGKRLLEVTSLHGRARARARARKGQASSARPLLPGQFGKALLFLVLDLQLLEIQLLEVLLMLQALLVLVLVLLAKKVVLAVLAGVAHQPVVQRLVLA